MTDSLTHLKSIYGEDRALQLYHRLQRMVEDYRRQIPALRSGLSERDSVLITYGDQVQTPGEKPLQTLGNFCSRHLNGVVGGIHILPFYPWTSDDGFAVSDYRQVDPALGGWEDVTALQDDFDLMFDAVINHVSAQNGWFQAFLKDDPQHREYFIVVDGAPDLSAVVRPRALPLLTRFETPSGSKKVWTTFSEDQVDLNFGNPEVLLEVVDTLLLYAARGARFIRLDAIAYLWKEIGTPCIHLPQTHSIIRLFRSVLDTVAPHVMLITETNVPHADNISYFGNGIDEAQMVYNFALPPLVLHTFQTGNSRVLTKWAAELELPSDRTSFFNFLASHDGIGVNPARGILSDAEIDTMIGRVREHGGLVSYKHTADGSQIPYELNVNFFDALSDPSSQEPLHIQVDRFMSAQAIMLAIVGVPGIYFHSLFGSRGWHEGVQQTGRNRTINRQKLDFASLERELEDLASLRHGVFSRYAALLRARSSSAAFHPHGGQRVLDVSDSVFTLLRTSPDQRERVLCLHNITDREQTVEIDFAVLAGAGSVRTGFVDIITREPYLLEGRTPLQFKPYQSLWLEANEGGA